jgi:flagellar biosynthesis/type III secretory pathway protein FliH
MLTYIQTQNIYTVYAEGYANGYADGYTDGKNIKTGNL